MQLRYLDVEEWEMGVGALKVGELEDGVICLLVLVLSTEEDKSKRKFTNTTSKQRNGN